MRSRLLLLLLLLATGTSFAQIVGPNVYLKGGYLEIGMLSNGAFGAPAPPAGYHPHFGSLAEVYDYGHDGWTVGTPAYMGDYTFPGYPFEGWEVQWGGTFRVQGFQSGYIFGGGATMTGSSVTSYSNIGGNKRAYWQGTTGPGGIMLMKSEIRVDTLASAVVVTVKFINTSAVTTIPAVYYMRSTDPDNDQTWPGGGFLTDNFVDIQNATIPNPTHKVEVTGIGRSTTRPPLTIGTKDSRAVAFIYNWWPLAITQDLAVGWAMTAGFGGGAFFNVGANHPGDIGTGIIWNLCDILPGDSTAISYAYIFNGPTGIDDAGALPDPIMTIGGVPTSGVSTPTSHDTIDGCLLPGVDSVAVDIPYGDDRSWVTGKWTWMPGTGLTATTGTHVYVRLTAIPGTITYTVIGTTDTGVCMPGLTDTFYFTARSCHLAWATDPCLGDPLHIGMVGDSLGATYLWTGPTGFTSTIHSPWIFPTTWADTGMYRVIRTIGGIDDTDYIRVVIHPLPIVTPTSNIPNTCDPLVSPFNLFVNLDSAGETFLWSGPLGFTSTMQNPVIAPFNSTMQGTYTVTGTTIWGCKATASHTVVPGVTPDFDFVIHYGCLWDTVYFNNKSVNASSYRWEFGDGTPDVYTRHTMHVFKHNNVEWFVKLIASNAFCTANITKKVDARHEINAVFDASPDTICFNGGANSITFTNTSYANDSMFTNLAVNGSFWRYGDGTFDTTSSPSHSYSIPGIFPVTLIVTDAMGCPDSVTHEVFVVHLDIKSFNDTMLCISQPLAMRNEVISIPDVDPDWEYKHTWTHTPANLDNDAVATPYSFGIGLFTNIHTVTIPGIVPDGCPTIDTMIINSVEGKKLQNLTVSQTIDYGSSIQLNSSNEVIYYWMPNDGSLDNNNINNPIATPKRTTTYTVYGIDDNGCRDSAYITVYVDTTMDQDVPSAFSPNGDGLNDVFKPVGMKFQNMVEFRVFNRWGQEIFYTNSKEVGWDGTFQGTKQDLGVYNYIIIVGRPGQSNIAYKGNVTLIR